MRTASGEFYDRIESAFLMMAPVKIIIPVSNYEKVERYYRDVLQFEVQEDLFFLPNGARDVALKLLIVDAASRETPGVRIVVASPDEVKQYRGRAREME